MSAILVGSLLLSAACGRSERLDPGVANQLLDVLERRVQPSFHDDELARISQELPRYQRFLGDHLAGGNEFYARDALAAAYASWRYDAGALAILRDGLKAGQLGPQGKIQLVLQAAVTRDVSTLEEGWRSFADTAGTILSKSALEAIAVGDIANGVAQALNDVDREDEIGERSLYRTFIARVVANNPLSPRLQGFEAKVFDTQLREFLRGGDWREFLARFSVEQHDLLHTVLLDDLISTMGSAAEYYAKLGNEVKKEEWLKRMMELGAALRKQGSIHVDWLDYLVERAKRTAVGP